MDATVAWLPLEEGPMPVAMETKEKGIPEDVQVDEPDEMGAMSAEEAGETVGCNEKKKKKEVNVKSALCSLQLNHIEHIGQNHL